MLGLRDLDPARLLSSRRARVTGGKEGGTTPRLCAPRPQLELPLPHEIAGIPPVTLGGSPSIHVNAVVDPEKIH
uniref:Uncharacterized protein n=1 Tax=Sphaerodactylus townsendi TaxID=933632 RepID=A0ACB8FZS7_9SAUR